jgi:hypothetical protein
MNGFCRVFNGFCGSSSSPRRRAGSWLKVEFVLQTIHRYTDTDAPVTSE